VYSFMASPVFSGHCWSQSVVYFSTCGDGLSHSAYLNSQCLSNSVAFGGHGLAHCVVLYFPWFVT
jgi:hypothetical protein